MVAVPGGPRTERPLPQVVGMADLTPVPVAPPAAPTDQADGATGRRAARRATAATRRADALAAYLEPALRALPVQDRPADPAQLRRWLAAAVHTSPGAGDALYDTYARATAAPPPRTVTGPPAHSRLVAGWCRTFAWFRAHVWNSPAAVFAVATGAATTGYVTFANHLEWHVPALSGFVVLLLTLLPGFLYLRFITFRIRPMCDEYVDVLHRMGVDAPSHLPEPPRGSAAWRRWYDDGGPLLYQAQGAYRAKFEAQYGRWPSSDDDEHKETLGRLLSVYLCLLTLGVGWAVVVWTADEAATLPRTLDALRFGFLGAYFYLLSLLIRRYFQNDLRPGTYLSGVVRVVTVLLLVLAVDQVFAMQGAPADRPHTGENATAFVIGIFPSVGMQLLRRAVGTLTGRFRGGVEPPFPLGQLDGMDIWSEARLLEVGIEDVQHLATANLVDVCLGARIPPQRVVDWVDQSLLLLRTGLPKTDNLRQPTTYAELRGLGIRSCTDLLELARGLCLDLSPGSAWPDSASPVGALLAVPQAAAPTGRRGEVRPSTVPLLTRIGLAATTLRHEPNLPPVQHWHATAHDAERDRGTGLPQQGAGS